MKYLVFVLLVLGFIGCSKEGDVIELASGVNYADVSLGTGRAAKIGDLVSVHFRAWVIKDSTNIYKDWSKDSTRQASTIGSSIDFGQPVKFKLGDSAFIKGVDEGIVGMKLGGKRTIIEGCVPSAASLSKTLYAARKNKFLSPDCFENSAFQKLS